MAPPTYNSSINISNVK